MKQYRKLLAMDGVKLSFEDGALRALARAALERKTGARGLRSLLETLMTDVMYEAPGNKSLKKAHITQALVEAQLKKPGTLLQALAKASTPNAS